MKKIVGVLVLAFALTCTSLAQTQSKDRVVIDGNQELEVGGLTLSNGTLEAGSLTIKNVDRIEVGQDGVHIFRNGSEAMFFPTNGGNGSSTTLQEGLLRLDEALGFEDE